ncbi:MAG: peptidylprolyl isomerase [Bacteroidales bacterium]|nr:peptidylprolyl isomerase [Bacteroidales bacterium]
MKLKLLYTLLAMSILFAGCKSQKAQETIDNPQPVEDSTTKVAVEKPKIPEEPIFKIITTEGIITVKLYKETPLHRDNFVKLATQNFYDGMLFHRVIKDFMIQVGDPLTKDTANVKLYGTGGPGYTIPAEIVEGKTHKKGALAAARRGDAANPNRESSGSQFYIVQNEMGCKHLDGQYTIFGETIDGFDIIDKIASAKTDGRDRPLKDIYIVTIVPDFKNVTESKVESSTGETENTTLEKKEVTPDKKENKLTKIVK